MKSCVFGILLLGISLPGSATPTGKWIGLGYKSLTICIYDQSDLGNEIYLQNCAPRYLPEDSEGDTTPYHKCLRAAFEARLKWCE